MERLVGVDVAHSGQNTLIEKDAFQTAFSSPHPGDKILKRNFKRFGTEITDLVTGVHLPQRETSKKSEFPNIAKTELLGSVVKKQDEMRMLVARNFRADPEKPSRHFEMEKKRPVFSHDDQYLSSPAHGRDSPSGQSPEIFRRRRSEEFRKNAVGGGDPESDDPRSQARGHGFNFGEFGHRDIVSDFRTRSHIPELVRSRDAPSRRQMKTGGFFETPEKRSGQCLFNHE